MNAVAKALCDVPNAPTTLTVEYTVPASTTTTVTFISVANKTASTVTATIQLGTIVFVPTSSVAANSVATFDLKKVLSAGQTIQVQAGTASALDISINGTEVS